MQTRAQIVQKRRIVRPVQRQRTNVLSVQRDGIRREVNVSHVPQLEVRIHAVRRMEQQPNV